MGLGKAEHKQPKNNMKRTDTFQNLLLITLADGVVTPAEKSFIDGISFELGITDEEYSYYIENILNLSYVIPTNKDDAFQELYKMTLLCLADGELGEDEEQTLYEFASACGFTQDEYDKILSYVLEQYDNKQTEVIAENKEIYDNTLLILRQAGKSDIDIVQLIRQVVKKRNLDYIFSEEETTNHAFYALLWLIYCRYVKINSGGLALIVMILELVEAGEYTLEDLFIDLKLSEEMANDGQVLNLFIIPTETIKNDLKNNFPFNK